MPDREDLIARRELAQLQQLYDSSEDVVWDCITLPVDRDRITQRIREIKEKLEGKQSP